MDEQIIKVDSDTVEIITPQPDKRELVMVEEIKASIDWIKLKINDLTKQYENDKLIYESQITDLESQLEKAQTAGVIPDGVVESEIQPIPVEEPILEPIQTPVNEEPIEEVIDIIP